ncbi:MAG: S41 family peptidase [Candidatus Hinthialibacter antarcticus]|nr:S41 family peptidase [Candidatus Hinthialibacter antarcticus]
MTSFVLRLFSPRRSSGRPSTGEWQYDKPVIVLIGQRCMSSNEAFVKMMGECPNVTLMGEATRGSSGNPKMLDLPMGIQVSVPQWIDYRADGKPLEGNGVEPDVEFIVDGNEYNSDKDSLLDAALERLRKI